MTEGIIQKVFAKYKGYRFSSDNNPVLELANHIQLISLEKELIREIKKNVSEWSKQNNTPLPRYVKLDVLIGDSD